MEVSYFVFILLLIISLPQIHAVNPNVIDDKTIPAY